VIGPLEVGGQLIELKLPELTVSLDPRLRVAHRRSDQRRATYTTLAPDASEAGPLQHVNVLRHGRQRHVEPAGEFGDRMLAGRES
jgi:hypothetical protein